MWKLFMKPSVNPIDGNMAKLLYKIAKLGKSYDYGSTQIQLPPDLTKLVLDYSAGIPDLHLFLGEGETTPIPLLTSSTDLDKDAWNGYGREDDIHVTVKYGLHTTKAGDVRKIIEKEKPIQITLGEISLFEQDGYEVVKIEVLSPGLHALNKKISKNLKCTDTFPTYKPHVTIAYVKPGEGEAMEGKCSLTGKSFVADEVVFSPSKGEKKIIKLGDPD